jgi:hypothetical protein
MPSALTGIQRSNDATTSCAFISSPLWNGTLWRRVMVLVRPSSLASMPSASIGTVAYSLSKVNSASYMFQVIIVTVRCPEK